MRKIFRPKPPTTIPNMPNIPSVPPPKTNKSKDAVIIIKTTPELIAAAFTEWDRRYRNDPEAFTNEVNKLLRETPDTYGQACAPYFIKLLNEI